MKLYIMVMCCMAIQGKARVFSWWKNASPEAKKAPNSRVARSADYQAVKGNKCNCAGKDKKSTGYCDWYGTEQPYCETSSACGGWKHKPVGEDDIIKEGYWIRCNRDSAERRLGVDGKWYDFHAHYTTHKGKDARKEWGNNLVERRTAPDGLLHTFKEFHDLYVETLGEEGALTRWRNASPEAKKQVGKHYSGDDKCCKQCDPEKSIPCGNACIPKGKTCHKGKGCACSSKCCKQCDPEKSIPCGDACIPKGSTCHKGKGCACSKYNKFEL
jgi:hypothetical protein